MWTMLLKPLIGVAGDAVQNMAKAKAAKAEQKITEIRANTEILNKQIKGEIAYDLEAIKGSKDSWKDEAWTILFIIIIAMCFIPPLQPYTERGFDALSRTPQWFQFAMYGAIASSFGLRGMGKVLGNKK